MTQKAFILIGFLPFSDQNNFIFDITTSHLNFLDHKEIGSHSYWCYRNRESKEWKYE